MNNKNEKKGLSLIDSNMISILNNNPTRKYIVGDSIDYIPKNGGLKNKVSLKSLNQQDANKINRVSNKVSFFILLKVTGRRL